MSQLPKHNRFARYFDLKIEEGGVILYIRPEIWIQETYLDGKFFLKTNLSREELSAADVVRSYKKVREVERFFRDMKDLLRIWHIFLYTDSRTKPHLYLVLSSFIF
jgi:transposase